MEAGIEVDRKPLQRRILIVFLTAGSKKHFVMLWNILFSCTRWDYQSRVYAGGRKAYTFTDDRLVLHHE